MGRAVCTIPTLKSGLPHVGRDDDDGGVELCIVHNPCRVHSKASSAGSWSFYFAISFCCWTE